MNEGIPPLAEEKRVTTLVYWLYKERREESFEDDAELTQTRDSARLLVDLWKQGQCIVETITLPNHRVLHGFSEVLNWLVSCDRRHGISAPPGRAWTPNMKQAIINRLLKAWLDYPELRLGQLISTATHRQDLFSIEDSALINDIEHLKERVEERHQTWQ